MSLLEDIRALSKLVRLRGIKGWIQWDGSQAAADMIQDSYNVDSMTDNGAGDYTINWQYDFDSNDYAVAGLSNTYHTAIQGMTGATTQIYTRDVNHATADCSQICIIAIGDNSNL